GVLNVEGVIASLDGSKVYRDHIMGQPADAEAIGQQLADRLLEAGGRTVLAELGIEL
ncbi:hydroxymethylbilane synthase, partial [Anaerovibrio lipolyticus]